MVCAAVSGVRFHAKGLLELVDVLLTEDGVSVERLICSGANKLSSTDRMPQWDYRRSFHPANDSRSCRKRQNQRTVL